MKHKRLQKNRSVYGALAAINACLVLMFAAILFPKPEPIVFEPLVSSAPQYKAGPAPKKINLGIPVRVVVPSVGIDLPVRTGSYDPATRTWTLDEKSAFYGDRTVPVNDSNGSTLIYAHARYGLFARLPEISKGATAQVFTDSGKVFNYKFESSREVTPDDTSIFVNKGNPKLTLQTCSGPFDAYRTLVSFNLTGVSS